jgi:membrane associated rhomboid family serine protease
MTNKNDKDLISSELEGSLSKNLRSVFGIVIICWASYFISLFTPINSYGIHPRDLWGLLGIVFSPFLHGGLGHLIANTSGLLIFGAALAFLEKKMFGIILGIILLGGAGTWVFARNANHIGASGLIFGLFGYLLSIGYFEKKPKYILVSIITLLGYGSMIFGVLPSLPGISWEGHLFGFLAGVASAKWR